MSLFLKNFTLDYAINGLELFDDLPYKWVKAYISNLGDGNMVVNENTIPVLMKITKLTIDNATIEFKFTLTDYIYLASNMHSICHHDAKVIKHYTMREMRNNHLCFIFTQKEESAIMIQALVRGIITRNKIHIALLSSESDALQIAISSIITQNEIDTYEYHLGEPY